MREGLLSVIVLCYGQNALITEALDSIFLQDYPNIELIISEDGSNRFDKEHIVEYIKKYAGPNIKSSQVIVNKVNKGTVKNINGALEFANGEYIKLLAADDTYPNSTVFSRQVECIKHENCEIAVGNVVECDFDMKPLSKIGFSQLGIEDLLSVRRYDLLKYVCLNNTRVLATQAICFTQQFFKRYGTFDERFRLVEDLPLAVKIAKENVGIGYVDTDCVNHRGAGGISTSVDAFDKKRIYYYADLANYFEYILMPLADALGKKQYIKMRLRVAKFRVDYCQCSEKMGKFLLIIKNIYPLTLYCLSKRERAIKYINKMLGKK